LIKAEEPAGKSWYKVGTADIPVASELAGRKGQPLSAYSSVVANLKPIDQVLLYARREDADVAGDKIRQLAG
jgi:hypothetical protein